MGHDHADNCGKAALGALHICTTTMCRVLTCWNVDVDQRHQRTVWNGGSRHLGVAVDEDVSVQAAQLRLHLVKAPRLRRLLHLQRRRKLVRRQAHAAGRLALLQQGKSCNINTCA
jgi:hypothetical protein